MLNRDDILRQYRRGKTYDEIAREMKCSSKQVGRILKEARKDLDQVMNRVARQGGEGYMWLAMIMCGYSPQEVADHVGISRQIVYEKIIEQTQEIDHVERKDDCARD